MTGGREQEGRDPLEVSDEGMRTDDREDGLSVIPQAVRTQSTETLRLPIGLVSRPGHHPLLPEVLRSCDAKAQEFAFETPIQSQPTAREESGGSDEIPF